VDVTTSDVTGATTLYYTPHISNRLTLPNGAGDQVVEFDEVSLDLTGYTADSNYDIWGVLSSGTVALESTIWTNRTTRATALVRNKGRWCKSGATTRLYLGTIGTTGSTSNTEDSTSRRLVYNAYNRFARQCQARITSTWGWTYTTDAYRAANNSTTIGETRFVYVDGLGVDPVYATTQSYASNSSVGVNHHTGVGVDSTTVSSAFVFAAQNPVVGQIVPGMLSQYRGFPGVGYHYIQWLERSGATGTTTWYAYGADTYAMGLVGYVFG
jgi:hypothetical protein